MTTPPAGYRERPVYNLVLTTLIVAVIILILLIIHMFVGGV